MALFKKNCDFVVSSVNNSIFNQRKILCYSILSLNVPSE